MYDVRYGTVRYRTVCLGLGQGLKPGPAPSSASALLLLLAGWQSSPGPGHGAHSSRMKQTPPPPAWAMRRTPAQALFWAGLFGVEGMAVASTLLLPLLLRRPRCVAGSF